MEKVSRIICSLILVLASTMVSMADSVIQMEKYNGVYRVPCTVNGAKMKFIFDTGASNVCISMAMAEYLYDNGFLKSTDVLGEGKSSVADGRIVDHIKINLRDLEIGGMHLNNVQAIVVASQNAPLLMGQSAIQKMGTVTIDGTMLKIKNNQASGEEIVDKLFNEAEKAYNNDMYDVAADKYGQLHDMHQLSDYGKYLYAWSLMMTRKYQTAKDVLGEINSYDYFEKEKIDIYRLIAHVNRALEQYSIAASYYELSSKKIQTEMSEWIKNLTSMGDCYYFSESWTKASENYRYAAMFFGKMHGIDMKYIQADSKNRLKRGQKSYRKEGIDIDYILYHLFYCNEHSGEWDTDGFLMEAAAMARAGNKYAQKMFNNAGIDPYSDCYK